MVLNVGGPLFVAIEVEWRRLGHVTWRLSRLQTVTEMLVSPRPSQITIRHTWNQPPSGSFKLECCSTLRPEASLSLRPSSESPGIMALPDKKRIVNPLARYITPSTSSMERQQEFFDLNRCQRGQLECITCSRFEIEWQIIQLQ